LLSESCHDVQHRQLKAAESVFLHRFYIVEQINEKQEGKSRGTQSPARRNTHAATPAPRDTVAATLSTAREALNAGNTDTAEAAIDSLNLVLLTR
jgi:hypothetical protein